jgi:hypothetical protein
MREGTAWRMIAADRPYGEFYDFYSVRLECFVYTLVFVTTIKLFILAKWVSKNRPERN